MKTCNKCGEQKPLEDFCKCSSQVDGHQRRCKSCDKFYRVKNKAAYSEYSRKWLIENKERKRASNINWQKSNPERRAAIDKRHAEKHPDRILVRLKSWRSNNAEHIAKVQRIWQKSNADKVNASRARYRSSMIGATPAWADKSKIEEIYTEAAELAMATGRPHHVDHIVPLSSRLVCGLHCEANLQILTAIENISKSNRHWPDMP